MAEEMKQRINPAPVRAPEAQGAGLVLVSLGMAVVAVILVWLYIEQTTSATLTSSFPVYVLSTNVQRSDICKLKDFEKLDVPNTPKFIAAMGDAGLYALSQREVGVRVDSKQPYARSARRGSLVTRSLFDTTEDGSEVTPEPDMVGYALRVRSDILPGSIRPGSFVNINAPFNTGSGAIPQMLTVMEMVKVSQVGSAPVDARGPSSYRTITIMVKAGKGGIPGEDLILDGVTLLKAGDYSLVLRNPDDSRLIQGINPQVMLLLKRAQETSDSGRVRPTPAPAPGPAPTFQGNEAFN